MKRFLCVFLIILSLVPTCYAAKKSDAKSFDLSGMTLNDLIELQEKVQLAMWSTDDWQEVIVPQGVYKVGVDIPAGKWTVKAIPKADCYLRFAWGSKLDDSKQHITFTGSKRGDIVMIYTKNAMGYKEGDLLEYSFECKKGDYIVVEYTSAVFTPYTGTKKLNFK